MTTLKEMELGEVGYIPVWMVWLRLRENVTVDAMPNQLATVRIERLTPNVFLCEDKVWKAFFSLDPSGPPEVQITAMYRKPEPPQPKKKQYIKVEKWKADDAYLTVWCDPPVLETLKSFGRVRAQGNAQYYVEVDPRFDIDEVVTYLRALTGHGD